MSSIIKFIRSMFSDDVENPKPVLILTRDKWVVVNPSAAEVLQISLETDFCDLSKRNFYDSSDVRNPLHPLNIKCGANLGMSMMCLTN